MVKHPTGTKTIATPLKSRSIVAQSLLLNTAVNACCSESVDVVDLDADVSAGIVGSGGTVGGGKSVFVALRVGVLVDVGVCVGVLVDVGVCVSVLVTVGVAVHSVAVAV